MKNAVRCSGFLWLAWCAAWCGLALTGQAVVTNTWIASVDSVATNPANWSLGVVPTNTHCILLDGTSQLALTWTNMPSTVAGWVQTTAYTNAVMIPTGRTGTFTNFTITGDARLEGGSWLGVANVNGSASAVSILQITCSNNLLISSNFVLSADACGFSQQKGPGYNSPGDGTQRGIAHGGNGGCYVSVYGDGTNYGSYATPTTLGSGAYTKNGGGAIHLTVIGDLQLDGRITAVGGPPQASEQAPSGGSIWITANTVSGTGIVTAAAGPLTSARAGGGGGRVAVRLTDPASSYQSFTNAFRGTLTAPGTRTTHTSPTLYPAGAAGTVYVETPADSGRGALILHNGTWTTNSSGTARIVSNDTWNVATLYLQSGGRVGIMRGGTLHLPTYTSIVSDGHVLNLLRLDDGGTLFSDVTNETLVATNFNLGAYGTNTFSAGITVKAPSVFTVDGDFTISGRLSLDGARILPGTYAASALSPRVAGAGVIHVSQITFPTTVLFR